MTFRDIEGQAEAIGFLRQAWRQGRIPSAYLFRGPHHVGKRSTALALAQALNCAAPVEVDDGAGGMAADACGTCPACRKIAEEVHADVDTVRPDGQQIRIDQVRAVGDRLALQPYEARKRVVILAQADRMNPAAANAFLKTLEEPPHNTLLVLCAQDVDRLPETIASRCVPVRFALLAEPTLRALLAAQGTAPEGPALDFAVRFAQGRLRPGLSESVERWLALREELIGSLEGLRRPIFPQVSEQCARWAGSDDWRFVLEWLETWFRDLALLGGGAPAEALLNGDRLEALQAQAAQFDAMAAERCYRRVLATRDALTAWNANKALGLEALWLDCKHIVHAAPARPAAG